MSAILEDFLCTSEKLEQNALLNKFVTLDRRSHRLAQDFENIFFLRQLPDVLDVLLAQAWLLLFSQEASDTGRYNLRPEGTASHAHVHVRGSTEDTIYFDSVTWLDAIDQIVLQNDLHAPGKLSRWRILRHLLDCHNLRVLVKAVAILVGERIAVLVLDWEMLTAICRALLLISAHLGQVCVIIIMPYLAFLSGLTVMD